MISFLLLSVTIYFFDKSQSIIDGYIIVVAIYLYLASFGFSLGPVVWIYLAEILPSKGMSIAVLTIWVTCSLIG